MKDIVKTLSGRTFWLGLIIFILTAVSVFFPNEIDKYLNLRIRSFIGIFLIILYFIIEVMKHAEISRKTTRMMTASKTAMEKIIQHLLSVINKHDSPKDDMERIIQNVMERVRELDYLSPGQSLRANIFHRKLAADTYEMIYQYNMDGASDRGLVIPLNMGVTGEVFRTKTQKIVAKKNFYGVAPYRLPNDLIQKVPNDLQWICSTPIINDKGDVIATLSFDGDRDCEHEFETIAELANTLVLTLKIPLAKLGLL
jgi:hypothetical protein